MNKEGKPNMAAGCLLTRFVEQRLGKIPHFLLCMVLEWVLILVLFLDGFLAFFTIEFAKYFELENPCWLCARMNHVLACKNPEFYYNNSFCGAHKRDVSSLAFCHNHKKLSEIKKLCDSCLLSFATGKESDCDTYKSLVGVLNKNLECSLENGQNVQLSLKDDGVFQAERNNAGGCSCCGAPLKIKAFFSRKNSRSFSRAPATSPRALQCLTPKNEEFRGLESPRALQCMTPKNEEFRGFESPLLRYSKLKSMSQKDFDVAQNKEVDNNENNQNIKSRVEDKRASLLLLTEAEDSNNESPKTPLLPWSSRYFGLPQTDSPNNSPRWSSSLSKKSSLGKIDLASYTSEEIGQDEVDEAIFKNLKSQARLDRKSLMALYTELDEERSASAVAANNAMAMITRLQEEKAALQMDSLQYQRMMEEQIEYDEEALQEYNDMILKLEEEMKTLETELEIYRDKYGCLTEDDFMEAQSLFNGGNEEKYFNLYQAMSSKANNEAGKSGESLKDFRMEKTYALGRMKKVESRTLLA